MAATGFILLNPIDFDSTRLVFKEPVEANFVSNGSKVSLVTSKVYYIDDAGKECDLYIKGVNRRTFGVNTQYQLGKPQDLQYLSGYQMMYQPENMGAPSSEGQAIEAVFDSLTECLKEFSQKEAKRKGTPIPPASRGLIATDPDAAIKPLLVYPKKKGRDGLPTAEPDTEKPRRAYVKLITKGKGTALRVITQFYGPGNKPKSPLEYLDRRIEVEPVFHVEGIYWGAHGTSTYGASVMLRVSEANVVPFKADEPPPRMLSANTAPVEDEQEELPPKKVFAEEPQMDEDFQKGGDTPMDGEDMEEPAPPPAAKPKLAPRKPLTALTKRK